jgi:hypothetical protein
LPRLLQTAFLENPAFTPILFELIRKSATPLRTVETEFAIDSSGFSSCNALQVIDALQSLCVTCVQ